MENPIQETTDLFRFQITEEQEEENASRKKFRRPRFSNFSAGVKYSYGYTFKDHFEFFDEYAPGFAAQTGEVYFSETELGYLKIMELKPSEVSIDRLKSQYKKLVKKYHPDLNRDDKDAEENFKKLSAAYKHLLAKFS